MGTPLAFLSRAGALDPGEREAALAAGFRLLPTRAAARPGERVLARLSAWPFPEELDADLHYLGAEAVNTARAYRYAASLVDWTADLGDLAPRAWTDFSALPEDRAFVVKGEQADKGCWARMYAADAAGARRLLAELQRDTGFAGQDLVAREYVPLQRLGVGAVTQVPVSLEYRVFFYGAQELGRAFYWPEGDCDVPPPPPDVIDGAFLREASRRVVEAGRIPYYALDVGCGVDGRWHVIEVTDGQRAGLQGLDPGLLYRRLADAIDPPPTTGVFG